MKLIIPSVEMCHPGYGLDDIKRHIVRCAQNCYKVDKEVEDPDKWLHERLLDKDEGDPQHTSPLAHGAIYLTVTISSPLSDPDYMKNMDMVLFYQKNKYSRVVKSCKDNFHTTYYISTNYRVVYENHRESDLEFLTKPFKKHIKRYTFKVNCDIGVSREANRHTTVTPSEQSTRYCNYSKDKFGNELQIEMPIEFMDMDWADFQPMSFKDMCEYIAKDQDDAFSDFDFWWFGNLAAEYSYMNLIRLGWKPQQARRVLLLDTHTEVYYSAYEDDWDHFLYLRDHKNAHPDMRLIARMINKLLTEERNKYK